jgi:hypothetical protein
VDARITRAPMKSWALATVRDPLPARVRGETVSKRRRPPNALRVMRSKTYPSHPADDEWDLLEPLLPVPKKRGRPKLRRPRETLDAVFYGPAPGRYIASRQDDRHRRGSTWLRRSKKIKGRKRQLLVDTQDLVLEARVHSAKIQDRQASRTCAF